MIFGDDDDVFMHVDDKFDVEGRLRVEGCKSSVARTCRQVNFLVGLARTNERRIVKIVVLIRCTVRRLRCRGRYLY